jgi:hypothetical protein
MRTAVAVEIDIQAARKCSDEFRDRMSLCLATRRASLCLLPPRQDRVPYCGRITVPLLSHLYRQNRLSIGSQFSNMGTVI